MNPVVIASEGAQKRIGVLGTNKSRPLPTLLPWEFSVGTEKERHVHVPFSLCICHRTDRLWFSRL